MTSTHFLAVAAPSTHVEVSATPQVAHPELSAGNYLGGAAIFTLLAVMVASGLSAAGIINLRRSSRGAATRTVAHH
jgi:hypothetical protein